tara:strand:- start:577 stop:693 length:117 start_codon:yes stop_codon:yes gene_type:complete
LNKSGYYFRRGLGGKSILGKVEIYAIQKLIIEMITIMS